MRESEESKSMTYELRKCSVEIPYRVMYEDMWKIEPGYAWEKNFEGTNCDTELISTFNTLADAEKELAKRKTDIRKYSGTCGSFFRMEEYFIEENAYDEEGEWVSGGDVPDFSKMEIEVEVRNNEDDYWRTLKICNSLKEADEVMHEYDGEGDVRIPLFE